MMIVTTRPEHESDAPGVRAVNLAAFPTPAEADLVDRLRGRADPFVSLVALDEVGRIIGHILFTRVRVESAHELSDAVGLGPMAVHPEFQRRGVGSRLVRDGLAACRAAGEAAVFVLGHPTFYPRFGFVPASRFGIRWERDVPDDVFMALELTSGALRGRSGVVRYQPEFDEV